MGKYICVYTPTHKSVNAVPGNTFDVFVRNIYATCPQEGAEAIFI